ncbi:MAG: hypothetical protein JXQ30_02495 [Spirochaetes bacterium]|nr:hypothetical protein [Spirochaetota bacterium]
MNPKVVIVSGCLLSLVIFILFGCGGGGISELKKERLFSIQIGGGEEQIGVVREESGRFHGPSMLIFKNGFFYLVDSVNQKILKITTPGDVILTLSKGENDGGVDENVLRTKQRTFYELNEIGQIAVDNENCIWVEDKFLEEAPEKEEIDLFSSEDIAEEGAEELFKSYILKFDRLGRYVMRIGMGGRDTEPFYYIYKMAVDRDGNLTVLTADDEWKMWNVYRFDTEGTLLEVYSLSDDDITHNIRVGEGQEYFVMGLYPACNEDHLLFWVSLYETRWDTKKIKREEDLWGEEIEIENLDDVVKEEEKRKNGYVRDLLFYKLFYYDMGRKTVTRTYAWENRLETNPGPTTEFFGIDAETNGFLWKYVNNSKSIVTIFRPNGSVIARRSFVFEDDGIWTNVHVDEDGSVSAIKIDREAVHFYRWRSDKLITPGREEKLTVKEFVQEKIEEFRNANR